MSDPAVSTSRPAFTIQDCFLETAFEVRFQGLLRQARQARTWHVIAALPGSGKSLGITDLTHQSNSHKHPRRGTHIPLLAIRAPKNGGKDLALLMALCAAFGIVPAMPWYVRRAFLIHALAEAGVECLIIDDAQDLTLAHLAFLKELTDNLAAAPYERQVSLCLVAAHTGAAIPLKEIFSRSSYPVATISASPGYGKAHLVSLPGTRRRKCVPFWPPLKRCTEANSPFLQLCRWTKSIFTWLTHATLDPEGSKRVTMDHLTRLGTRALRQSYEEARKGCGCDSPCQSSRTHDPAT
jgi:hypothetical protein